jgi:hypothetical protein
MPVPVVAIGVVWFAVALTLGVTGVTARLRPPAPQLVLLGLTASLIAAWRLAPSFRRWLHAVDLRALVALHVTRFVGLYFLWAYSNGLLPFTFAVPGGVGDIVVATLALFLASAVLPIGEPARRVYLAWNVLGLIDILLVVVNAARLGMQDPGSMQALLRLPLSLLPTFLVPLIIASHVVIFARLTAASWQPASPASGADPGSRS